MGASSWILIYKLSYQEKALELLKKDAEKIAQLNKSANGQLNDASMSSL